VLTDTVYRRQKHPFMSPPAAQNPNDRLNAMVSDTLRGSGLDAVPFFDRKRVNALLDRIPSMDAGEQTAVDQVLMLMLSGSILGQRFHLT
jgi:asparagine synthase (glutamine-hydrolysing)